MFILFKILYFIIIVVNSCNHIPNAILTMDGSIMGIGLLDHIYKLSLFLFICKSSHILNLLKKGDIKIEEKEKKINDKIIEMVVDLSNCSSKSSKFGTFYCILHLTLYFRNVIGRAVTGSGKTMAFSIPIVQKISSQK